MLMPCKIKFLRSVREINELEFEITLVIQNPISLQADLVRRPSRGLCWILKIDTLVLFLTNECNERMHITAFEHEDYELFCTKHFNNKYISQTTYFTNISLFLLVILIIYSHWKDLEINSRQPYKKFQAWWWLMTSLSCSGPNSAFGTIIRAPRKHSGSLGKNIETKKQIHFQTIMPKLLLLSH